MLDAIVKTESNAEYHGDRSAVSKSRLSRMAVCPAYFKYHETALQNKTPDLIFGSLFHKLVLEPEDMASEFVVAPTIDRRTKAGKEEYDRFVASVGDRDVVTADMLLQATGMKEAVFSNPRALKLLRKNTTIEQSIYFTDDVTGERCKCRPDARKHMGDRIIITDLKSCRSASSEAFTRDVERYSYDLQAYMYRKGVSAAFDVPPSMIDFVFVPVEKEAPYLMNIFRVDETIYQSGEAKFRQYMDMYHECRESGEWYGLNGKNNDIIELTLSKEI